jgi:hypothetical protein
MATATATNPKTVNLATIVHESEAAAKEAADAVAKAQAATTAAEAARLAVEREQQAANQRYLQLLESEYPAARETALNVQVAARAALEDAVAGEADANVFSAYRAWVSASVDTWATDAALQAMRYQLGKPTRETNPPAFNFSGDIAAIIDHLSLIAQDDALERVRTRRAAFLSGKEA